MDRKTRFLWMKDVLEHLAVSVDEWQRADCCEERFLSESVERDLQEFRRLYSSMRREPRLMANSRPPVFV